ncbi:hypothetical protein H9P43_009154 [Blastocladiella emersonii ATCC 22665]|nr:hypothetical protein H9P43_009132 [Blastocladiella emersonii ATCC 22665]KAI9156044.1 hypothetical protein H9P43_009154 [Blastocladiella emersonii ATCC 22665]
MKHGIEVGEDGRSPVSLVDLASGLGCKDVLEHLHKRQWIKHYTERAVDDAATAGHIGVLRWWQESCLSIKMTERAYYGAVEKDDLDLVDCVCQMQLAPTNYVECPTIIPRDALMAGSINILNSLMYENPDEWWMIAMGWDSFVRSALHRGTLHVRSLDWILNNVPQQHLKPYPLNNPNPRFDYTSVKYKPFFDSIGGLVAETTDDFWKYVVLCATEYCAIEVLDWASISIALESLACPVTWICVNHDDNESAVLERLAWWMHSGIQLAPGPYHLALSKAEQLGFGKVTAWWRESGLLQLN